MTYIDTYPGLEWLVTSTLYTKIHECIININNRILSSGNKNSSSKGFKLDDERNVQNGTKIMHHSPCPESSLNTDFMASQRTTEEIIVSTLSFSLYLDRLFEKNCVVASIKFQLAIWQQKQQQNFLCFGGPNHLLYWRHMLRLRGFSVLILWKVKSEEKISIFLVLTTLFQSTYFTNFTSKPMDQ